MKKIIITIMAIVMTMSLVSCKDESEVTATTEPTGVETITTENIETETIIFEGIEYENVRQDDELEDIRKRYEEGKVSKEAYEEYLFNSQQNEW